MVPLEEVVGKEQPLDPDLYKMAEVLAELPEYSRTQGISL